MALDLPTDVNRREFVRSELADAAGTDSLVRRMVAHLPAGRWAEYRLRYRWRPVFEGVAMPDRLEPVHFFNGERSAVALPLDPESERAGLPVPSYLSFDDPRTNRSYEIALDEEEALTAFARVGADGRAVELLVGAPSAKPEAAAGGAALEVQVRSAAATVVLRRAKVDVFARR